MFVIINGRAGLLGGCMSTKLEEIQGLLGSLSETDLTQVRDFVAVLLKEPAELTEEEQKDVRKGLGEFRRGQWVKWETVRRQDV